jgi:hypothetical protein
MADNLTTFMCRLSGNLGASTSWNPQGLSRPVMGLFYLYVIILLNVLSGTQLICNAGYIKVFPHADLILYYRRIRVFVCLQTFYCVIYLPPNYKIYALQLYLLLRSCMFQPQYSSAAKIFLNRNRKHSVTQN